MDGVYVRKRVKSSNLLVVFSFLLSFSFFCRYGLEMLWVVVIFPQTFSTWHAVSMWKAAQILTVTVYWQREDTIGITLAQTWVPPVWPRATAEITGSRENQQSSEGSCPCHRSGGSHLLMRKQWDYKDPLYRSNTDPKPVVGVNEKVHSIAGIFSTQEKKYVQICFMPNKSF